MALGLLRQRAGGSAGGACLIGRFLHERVQHHRHRLDVVGAGILTLGLVSLLFAAVEGGQLWGWTSPVTLGLVLASLALLAAFVVFERRVPEPLIDLDLLHIPVIAAGLAIGGLSGVVMFSLSTYVPPLVQGVMGGTALQAGVAVAAMSIGWPSARSSAGGRCCASGPADGPGRDGHAVAGRSWSRRRRARDPRGRAGRGRARRGDHRAGHGPVGDDDPGHGPVSVPWQRRAVATGLVQFSRTIGGAVGVGLLGGIVTAAVGDSSAVVLDPIGRNLIRRLSSPRCGPASPPASSGSSPSWPWTPRS